ncbi:uncharacterized protein LOC122072678 isoform X2 [Macadamia integrifolia]|nr:uncharacterized protein LOC122072678 isoform X2 [Macadamia integrifolia]XP_042492999.1 uncharacterized protein LOC122072678 isoform X2 [Macadamia integrifolia]
MALEGDVLQGPISNSKGSDQIGDALSSEDVAWVDSCLVNDPELFDSDWDALKDALLDIVNSQSNSHIETLEAENGSHSRETSGELLPMNEDDEAGSASYPEGTGVYLVPSIEETKNAQFPDVTDDDLVPDSEKAETARYCSYVRSDFLNPHDAGENGDDGVDLWSTNEFDSSSGDIFKVWDLDTPTEEDELVKQLKKALTESSLRATPSTPDGGTDSNEEALDDLIAGIADLSLHPYSS